jgi:hypothetical protein
MSFHTYQRIDLGSGVTAHWVHDEDYHPEFALDTPEETEAAEKHEQEMLDSGDYLALGCVIETACECCGGTVLHDSLWGIVVNSSDCLETYARENMELPERPNRN